jgi:isopentenyl phosphate kinase
MQTKFKRHQSVRLLVNPDLDYIEYHNTEEELDKEHMPPITKGMEGKINMLLPNGKYHVEVFDSNGKRVAYVVLEEENITEI